MRASLLGLVGVASLLATAACGGGDGGTGPGGGGAGMSARIDGASWAANQVQVTPGSAQVPGSVIITGVRVSGTSTSSLILGLGFIAGPGTYPLGVNQVSSAGGVGQLLETSPASVQSRTTPLNGNGGTVVITTLTSTHLTGTFAFTAAPILGSQFTGNKQITNGQLDIDLPTPLTAVPAANHGSRVSATLGGTAFNGATVVGLGSAGSFSFGGNSDSLTISFVTATPVTAAGTYAFHTGINVSVSDLKLQHNWGGISGDAGSVIVTSVANGRVQGTFSGTLHTQMQGLTDLTITNGAFDVRIDPSP
jgi:hypothetical protein